MEQHMNNTVRLCSSDPGWPQTQGFSAYFWSVCYFRQQGLSPVAVENVISYVNSQKNSQD